MYYHNITCPDMNNGDGLRVVLWVSGCSHHCIGCQNPQTWSPESGILFDKEAENELFTNLDKDYISGITFSGGDPLYQDNRQTILTLCEKIRHKYNNSKTIWLYTGYTFEEIMVDPVMSKIIKTIDVLIDGEYKEELRDITLPWRGSSNQRIIKISGSNNMTNLKENLTR